MVIKLKKILKWTILIGVLVVASTTFYYYKIRCNIENGEICYIGSEDVFQIEENVSLVVQVESESMGEYLVETWNNLHTTQQGAITYEVMRPLGLKDLLENESKDIVLTSIYNGAYAINQSKDMGQNVRKHILNTVPTRQEDAMNLLGTYFIPNSISGWTFVYNQTLAESLGIDLTDENKDGIPDSFDSFEKIAQMSDTLLADLSVSFPLTFSDQYSFYPFLTSGKWSLNFTYKGMEPGFDTPEFLRGLELIEFFSEMNLRKGEDLSAQDLDWIYDTAFIEKDTLFTIAEDWMRLDYHSEFTGDTYVKTIFPTFNGNHLSPMAEVYGYMVDKDVAYPSAAAEVLRILRAPEAISHHVSDDTFIYIMDDIEDMEYDSDILAYRYSKPQPVIALDDNPRILARNLYYEVDFMDVLKDLYDGKITKETAQERIVSLSDAWLQEKGSDSNVEDLD